MKQTIFLAVTLFFIHGEKTLAGCGPFAGYKLASESYAITHHSSSATVSLCLADSDTLKVYYGFSGVTCGPCIYHPEWYKDGVLVCMDSFSLTITTPGFYSLRACSWLVTSFDITNSSSILLGHDSLHFQVFNGTYQFQTSDNVFVFKIHKDECLKVKARERVKYCNTPAEIVDVPARWDFNGVSFAFTPPGNSACLDKEGFFTLVDTAMHLISSYRIQIVFEDDEALPAIKLPYPFSELPEGIPADNLRYVVMNSFGQKVQEGKVNGNPVLRNNSATQSFKPGLYLVLYYQGEANFLVLTDKVILQKE